MNKTHPPSNVVLIGMPGVGKSTVGVLLAKALSKAFLDTDLLIQSNEGRRLQDIIDADGLAAFRAIEERRIAELNAANTVIATGGSVPYSERAMASLKADGIVVFLDLPLDELERRITNMDSRGIVIAPGQTFAGLYEERMPVYRRHAGIRIDCAGMGHEGAVRAVLDALR